MTTRHFLKLLAGVPLLGGCARSRRELNIGVGYNLRPWCYIDLERGEFTGFDVELAREVCALLGWRPVFHSIVWSEKERLLAAGKIDCVWSSFTVTGRERSYTLLGSYASNRVVVVVRRQSGIRCNADLKGRSVMVQAGSSEEATLGKRGPAAAIGASIGRLQSSPHMQTCVKRMRDGFTEALVVDEDMANAVVRESAGMFEIVKDRPLAVDGFGIGFRLGNTQLRDEIAEVLRKLERSGVCEKLSLRFFGHAHRFHFAEEAQ